MIGTNFLYYHDWSDPHHHDQLQMVPMDGSINEDVDGIDHDSIVTVDQQWRC